MLFVLPQGDRDGQADPRPQCCRCGESLLFVGVVCAWVCLSWRCGVCCLYPGESSGDGGRRFCRTQPYLTSTDTVQFPMGFVLLVYVFLPEWAAEVIG